MQGFDVMHLQMPFHGCNAQDPLHPISHQWFAQFAGKDGINSDAFPFMRFFVEPVWLTINYAKSIGYENIVMAGLSGGGCARRMQPHRGLHSALPPFYWPIALCFRTLGKPKLHAQLPFGPKKH